MTPETIILLALFATVVVGTLFCAEKSKNSTILDKRKRMLKAIVQEDLENISGTENMSSTVDNDLEKRLLTQYHSDDITPELVTYFVENYSTALTETMPTLSTQERNTPLLHVPTKEQLKIEQMTRNLDSIRVQNKNSQHRSIK